MSHVSRWTQALADMNAWQYGGYSPSRGFPGTFRKTDTGAPSSTLDSSAIASGGHEFYLFSHAAEVTVSTKIVYDDIDSDGNIFSKSSKVTDSTVVILDENNPPSSPRIVCPSKTSSYVGCFMTNPAFSLPRVTCHQRNVHEGRKCNSITNSHGKWEVHGLSNLEACQQNCFDDPNCTVGLWTDSWSDLYRGDSGLIETDVSIEGFNDAFWESKTRILRRVCDGCSPDYQILYYVRNPDETVKAMNVYEEVFQDFMRQAVDSGSDAVVFTAAEMKGRFGFNIYSHIDDALDASYTWSTNNLPGTNAWNSCQGGAVGAPVGFPGRCGPNAKSLTDQWTSPTEFRGGMVTWSIHKEGGGCILGNLLSVGSKTNCPNGECSMFEKEGSDLPNSNGVEKGPCSTLEECRSKCSGVSRYVSLTRRAGIGGTCNFQSTFDCVCIPKLEWELKIDDAECARTANEGLENMITTQHGWNMGTYTSNPSNCYGEVDFQGRLDGTVDNGLASTAICLHRDASEKWVKIDLGEIKNVYGIHLSGSGRSDLDEYVETFQIYTTTSINGAWVEVECVPSWTTDDGDCIGNADNSGLITAWFQLEVVARFIKFVPKTWPSSMNPSLRLVPVLQKFPILGGLTFTERTSDSPLGSGHFISGKSSVCVSINSYIKFDLESPYFPWLPVFGFRYKSKQDDALSSVAIFRVEVSHDDNGYASVPCGDGSFHGDEPLDCLGIPTGATPDYVATTLFAKPKPFRFIRLQPTACNSGGCCGTLALMFGNSRESIRGSKEAACTYPYGKTMDNFPMGGIDRTAVYYGTCLDPNFNIDAGGGHTKINDVLGFLISDAGASEQTWTTDKFDEMEWSMSANTYLSLNEGHAMVYFHAVDFNFLKPEMNFSISVRDQGGLYGAQPATAESMFFFTVNFPAGSGSIAVSDDGDLSDQNYSLKEFSIYNYQSPLEMPWAKDNIVQGSQITYAMKLLSEVWESPPQRCDSQGKFCINECSGKITVESHGLLDFESVVRSYTLNIKIFQSQYVNGVVTAVDIKAGTTVISVEDVNEPPSLQAVEYRPLEDTPTISIKTTTVILHGSPTETSLSCSPLAAPINAGEELAIKAIGAITVSLLTSEDASPSSMSLVTEADLHVAIPPNSILTISSIGTGVCNILPRVVVAIHGADVGTNIIVLSTSTPLTHVALANDECEISYVNDRCSIKPVSAVAARDCAMGETSIILSTNLASLAETGDACQITVGSGNMYAPYPILYTDQDNFPTTAMLDDVKNISIVRLSSVPAVATETDWEVVHNQSANADVVWGLNPRKRDVNFESTPAYTIALRVADTAGATAFGSIAVSIIDENESPVILEGPSFTKRSIVELLEHTLLVVPPIMRMDEDGDDTRCRLLPPAVNANNNALFHWFGGIESQSLVNDCRLEVKDRFTSQLINFESSNSLTVTVAIRDNAHRHGMASGYFGASARDSESSATLTITVTDVNEAPSFVIDEINAFSPGNQEMVKYFGNADGWWQKWPKDFEGDRSLVKKVDGGLYKASTDIRVAWAPQTSKGHFCNESRIGQLGISGSIGLSLVETSGLSVGDAVELFDCDGSTPDQNLVIQSKSTVGGSACTHNWCMSFERGRQMFDDSPRQIVVNLIANIFVSSSHDKLAFPPLKTAIPYGTVLFVSAIDGGTCSISPSSVIAKFAAVGDEFVILSTRLISQVELGDSCQISFFSPALVYALISANTEDECLARCEERSDATGCHYNDDHICQYTTEYPPRVVKHGSTKAVSDRISYCGSKGKYIASNFISLSTESRSILACKAACESLPATSCQYKSSPAYLCGYSTADDGTAVKTTVDSIDYTLKCSPIPYRFAYGWTEISAASSTIPPKKHAAAITYGENLVVFGGELADGTYDNSLWRIDIFSDDPRWEEISPTSPVVSGRGFLPAILYQGNVMVVFGGWDGTSCLNDIWHTDLSSVVGWTERSPSGALPGPRRGHSGVLFETHLIVFGGNDGSAESFNDLWKFDLSDASAQWTNLSPRRNALPARRWAHTAVLYKTTLVVFGGRSGNVAANDPNLNDFWEIDLSFPSSWHQRSIPRSPHARQGHSVIVHHSRMLIYGGRGGAEAYSDTWEIDLSLDQPMWKEHKLDVGTAVPPARSYHIAVAHSTNLVVFGGEGGTILNDLWVLHKPTVLHLARPNGSDITTTLNADDCKIKPKCPQLAYGSNIHGLPTKVAAKAIFSRWYFTDIPAFHYFAFAGHTHYQIKISKSLNEYVATVEENMQGESASLHSKENVDIPRNLVSEIFDVDVSNSPSAASFSLVSISTTQNTDMPGNLEIGNVYSALAQAAVGKPLGNSYGTWSFYGTSATSPRRIPDGQTLRMMEPVDHIAHLSAGAGASTNEHSLSLSTGLGRLLKGGTVITVSAIGNGQCDIRPLSLIVSEPGVMETSIFIAVDTTLTKLAEAGNECKISFPLPSLPVRIDRKNNMCDTLYPVQEAGENECMPPAAAIRTSVECEHASIFMADVKWVPGQSIVHDAARPKGCYKASDDKVYWNTHPTGVGSSSTNLLCKDSSSPVRRRCPMVGIGDDFITFGNSHSSISFPPSTVPENSVTIRVGNEGIPMKRSAVSLRWTVGDRVDKMPIRLTGKIARFCANMDGVDPLRSFCVRLSGVEQFCVSSIGIVGNKFDISMSISSGDYVDLVLSGSVITNCHYASLWCTIDTARLTPFNVDAISGNLEVVTPLNYEHVKTYTLVLQTMDSDGLGTQTRLTVSVVGVNEAPSIYLLDMYHFPENDVFVLLNSAQTDFSRCGVYSEHYLVVHDPDFLPSIAVEIAQTIPNFQNAFVITPRQGVYDCAYQFSIATSMALNHEMTAGVEFHISISDGIITVPGKLYVHVDDCNDAPVFALQYIDAKEDSVRLDIVGKILAYDEDATDDLVFSLLHQSESDSSNTCDPSGGVVNGCSWGIPSIDMAGTSNRFAIEKNGRNTADVVFVATGEFSGKQIRHWGNLHYRLKVHVHDVFLSRKESGANIQTFGVGVDGYVFISVVQVNAPPIFQNCETPRSVAENTFDPLYQNTIPILPYVSATDESSVQRVGYEIVGGNEQGAFRLEHDCLGTSGCLGRILLVGNATLDYDSMSVKTILLTIRARDNGPGTKFTECDILIVVVNRNERPRLLSDDGTLAIDENIYGQTKVSGSPIKSTDPDDHEEHKFEILEGFGTGGSVFCWSNGGNSATSSEACDNMQQRCLNLWIRGNNPLNFELSSAPLSVHVKVTDVVSVSDDPSSTPQVSETGIFVVAIRDINDPPVVLEGGLNVLLAENSPGGSAVASVLSRDEDGGQMITYSLEGRRLSRNNIGYSCWRVETTNSLFTMVPVHLDGEGFDIVFDLTLTDGIAILSFFGLQSAICDTTDAANPLQTKLYSILFGVLSSDGSRRIAVESHLDPCTTTSILQDEGVLKLPIKSKPFWVTASTSSGTISIGEGETFSDNSRLFQVQIEGVHALHEIGVSSTIGITPFVPAVFSSLCTKGIGAIQGHQILYENALFLVHRLSGNVVVRADIEGGAHGTLNYERNKDFGIQVSGTDSGIPAMSDSGFIRIHLLDENEPPVFQRNCPTSATYVACPTVNELSNVLGSGTNGFPSMVQAYDVDSGDTVQFTIVGGNSLNSAPAFFLVNQNPLNGFDFLDSTHKGYRGGPGGWKRISVDAYSTANNPRSFFAPYNRPEDIYLYEPQSARTSCDRIIFGPRDEFSARGGSFMVQQAGVFRTAAYVRISHDWVSSSSLEDGLLHVSLWGQANGVHLITEHGGVPENRGKWELVFIDASSGGHTVSHFAVHIGWTGEPCPTYVSGKMEVYGTRMYLLNSELDLRATNVQFDFETASTFELEVRVEDNGGTFMLSKLQVVVVDMNEPPDIEDHTFQVREDYPTPNTDTIVGSIEASDPDHTKENVWGSGSLSFSVTRQSEHDIVPNAFVWATASLSSDFHISNIQDPSLQNVWKSSSDRGVNYVDLNFGRLVWIESIIIHFSELLAPSEYSIMKWENEDASLGIGSGKIWHGANQLCTPDRIDTIDAQDGNVFVHKLRIILITPCVDTYPSFGIRRIRVFEHPIFEVSSSMPGSAVVSVRSGKWGGRLDYECSLAHEIDVRVTDMHGAGFQISARVLVTVLNVNEPPQVGVDIEKHPVITDEFKRIPENSPVSAAVGTPVWAFDPDILSREQLLFSLSSSPSHPFRVDSCGGQIRLGVESSLDFERQNQYSVIVRVTDNEGLRDSVTLTILIVDLNEPPSFSNPAWSVSMEETGWITKAAHIREEEGIVVLDNGLARVCFTEYLKTTWPSRETVRIIGTGVPGLNGYAIILSTPPPSNTSFYINVTGFNVPAGTISNSGFLDLWESGSKVGMMLHGNPVLSMNPTDLDNMASCAKDCKQRLSYSLISGLENDVFFSIDSVTGSIFLKNWGLNYESKNVYHLVIAVVDDARTSVWDAKGSLHASTPVTVISTKNEDFAKIIFLNKSVVWKCPSNVTLIDVFLVGAGGGGGCAAQRARLARGRLNPASGEQV